MILKKDFDKQAAEYMVKNLTKIRTIALATGNTPVGMYRELIKKKIDWRKIKIFMLDVNYPQDPDDQDSFNCYVKTNLPEVQFNILNSQAKDPQKECREYEAKIIAAGGLDLAILGIGKNGHIAYNEPGTNFDSLTHLAKLQNQKFEFGLTMGIKTIMSAKKIILLAKGKKKARAIKAAIEGPVSLDCPASVLQNHTDATFLINYDATGLLSNH